MLVPTCRESAVWNFCDTVKKVRPVHECGNRVQCGTASWPMQRLEGDGGSTERRGEGGIPGWRNEVGGKASTGSYSGFKPVFPGS